MVVRVPRIVPLPIYPSHDIGNHCCGCQSSYAAGFSFNQLLASASTMDTFSGQVANALAIQIELNLQLNIAVNFTIGCGF